MNRIFVDTSYYVALLSPGDSLHAKALELGSRLRGKFVTTEYVLTDVANFLSRAEDREVFLNLLQDLAADTETTILEGSHARFRQGVDYFARRKDKDWSLTDCVSFVIMEELQILDALTADYHYVQAGFHALLR